MHRCLYDATGEKQWHDLANKRFQLADQNGVGVGVCVGARVGVGVVSRGTESVPPPPRSAPSLLLLPPPTSPSKN